MTVRAARAMSLAVWAGALGAVGCSRQATPNTADAAPPSLSLIRVDTATVDVPLSLPSQVYVEHDALVYARSTGIVESVHVDLGTPVGEGQLLAQLENTDQAIALAQAEQAHASAQQVVERQRELAKSRAISSADSEEAEFAYQRALLARRQAQRNYDLTRVVAPFAGMVTARAVRPRRLVGTGDSLFRVSALFPLRASVHVPEGMAGSVLIGAAAEVVGLNGTAARATVIRASPMIDAASGTREIILELAPRSGLQPGASVTVRVGAERRRVVAIPREALAEQGYVLVWENGRTVLRAVTLGAQLRDGRLEVVSGLSPGEQVVRGATLPPSAPSR